MAIQTLKRWNVPKIFMLSIISAPEGIARLRQEFSDVTVFTCAIDRGLNERTFRRGLRELLATNKNLFGNGNFVLEVWPAFAR